MFSPTKVAEWQNLASKASGLGILILLQIFRVTL